MFQFPGFASITPMYSAEMTASYSVGFPHSEISGSSLVGSSPKLIAAVHVLHRLLTPRHPPYALSSLTKSPKARFDSSETKARKLRSRILLNYGISPSRRQPSKAFVLQRTKILYNSLFNVLGDRLRLHGKSDALANIPCLNFRLN